MIRRTFIRGMFGGGALLAARSRCRADVFGVLSPTASAYYCDSVNGSDSSNGLTPATAFATIAHMVSVDAGTNKSRWRLVSGSRFREELFPPRANMTIDVYGSGPAPILDCSVVMAPGGFTKTAGQTVTYQSTATITADPQGWVSIWENNVRLVRAADISSCNSTAGSYFPSSDTVSSITVYIHTSDDSNPAVNGKVYEISSIPSGFNCSAVTGTTIIGIQTQRNLGNDGSLLLGIGSIAINCSAIDGTKHNVFVQEGCSLYNVTAIGAYFAGQDISMFIGFMDVATGQPVYFKNCTASIPSYLGGNVGAFGAHVGSGSFGPVLFDGCVANNFGLAFGFTGSTTTFKNCTATSCLQAISSSSPTTIVGGYYSATHTGSAALLVSSSGVGWVISGGAVFDAGASSGVGSAAIWNCLSGVVSLSIQNCTLQNYIYGIRWNDPGCSLTLLNNSMNSSASAQQHIGFAGVTATFLNSDFNAYSGSGVFEYNSSGSISLSQWRILTGQDIHSTP